MSEQEIENVDATGMPVKRRVPTADVLRYMHQDFVTVDAEASKTRARIIGLINGNPPFSNKKLKDEGQTFRRNFNPRDSEAIIDPLCTADFNLVFDTHYSIKVTFTPGFFSDAYIAQAQGEKIAQAYTHVFKNSANIVEASQRGIRDKNELGVGFFINTNTYDWRPKAVARGRVFFNPSASADGSDLGEVTVIDTMTISEIFDTIDK